MTAQGNRQCCVVQQHAAWHSGVTQRMERQLYKLAEQLDSLDEASLMLLWNKYAQKVYSVQVSRQWEMDVLIFGLIQAKHLKNQLFNFCLNRKVSRGNPGNNLEVARRSAAEGIVQRDTPCAVSKFRPLKDDRDR